MDAVVVIGGNHHNTLGVLRSLGRKGIASYVILTDGDEDSFVLKSRYIFKSWIIRDESQIIKFLLEDLASPTKKVIIACSDFASELLDRYKSSLSPYFYIPCTGNSVPLSVISGKQEMNRFAASVGLKVPKSIILSHETLSAKLEEIVFPCITKPIYSRKGTKGEIVVCKNIDDLSDFLFLHRGVDYLIQEYIIKKIEYQFIGCSLDSGNEVIIPGMSEIIRSASGSNTGFLRYLEVTEPFCNVCRQSMTLIRKTGYSGLFSVEFIRDNNGHDYFLEINFRNDGNSISVTNAGVNLPYIWYQWCIGENYLSEKDCAIHVEYVMPEFQELNMWYSFNLSTRTLIKDFMLASSYMDYAKDDPNPTEGWSKFLKILIKYIFRRPAKYMYNVIRRKG